MPHAFLARKGSQVLDTGIGALAGSGSAEKGGPWYVKVVPKRSSSHLRPSRHINAVCRYNPRRGLNHMLACTTVTIPCFLFFSDLRSSRVQRYSVRLTDT